MAESDNGTATKGQVAYDATDAIVLQAQAARAQKSAVEFVVDSDDMLEAAADDLMAVKALQKKVEATRTTITGPLNQALRAVNDLFRPAGEFLASAENQLKSVMLGYTRAQAEKAAEAKREADRIAEIERKKQAAEQARLDQLARETNEKAQAAEKAAAEAAAAGDLAAAAKANEEARALAEAAQTTNAQIQEAAVTAAVLSMPPAVAAPRKVSGISTSTSYDFEVVDLMALLKHIVANPHLISLVVADSIKLRAQVKATGQNTALPGVRVFPKSTMSARSK